MICFLRKLLVVKNKFGRDESKLDSATLLILALKMSVVTKIHTSKPKVRKFESKPYSEISPISYSYFIYAGGQFRLSSSPIDTWVISKIEVHSTVYAKKLQKKGLCPINKICTEFFNIYFSDEDFINSCTTLWLMYSSFRASHASDYIQLLLRSQSRR